MNNGPDYKDNLAFEPEMTWEQLVEWAESKNLDISGGKNRISIGTIIFWDDKTIAHSLASYYKTIAENRTPAQMKLIIEELM